MRLIPLVLAHGLSIVNAKSVTLKTIPGDALFFYCVNMTGVDNTYASENLKKQIIDIIYIIV